MNIPYGPLLVVEDVPNILELLTVTLRFKGYPVVTAGNGVEALEMIVKERPALIITDILMPKMDGYAFVQKLRTDIKTHDIPIIFLSATYVTPEDKAFALSLGASRFIEKPIDTEDFLLTIAELLTQGPATLPQPLEDGEFYIGYRERLETKLQHKNTQITRTERLLKTLPEDQVPGFEQLLEQANRDRDQIRAELEQIQRILKNSPKK
ncbi:MAG: response regulator [Anaerolineae bacterium]|jgi:CheY-like chemotaxis protein|nr:response regulator [Anaerolineae bacterium]MBT3712675.1 response regulator [Anaerolineae bacterium]MBT4310577.1 response regulator [Anaerolineae bacterium]MBT4456704.1 response regulator [Anaerolineae bacterium]MBT4843211.1 response regulator [Anaerolineae bacterium]